MFNCELLKFCHVFYSFSLNRVWATSIDIVVYFCCFCQEPYGTNISCWTTATVMWSHFSIESRRLSCFYCFHRFGAYGERTFHSVCLVFCSSIVLSVGCVSVYCMNRKRLQSNGWCVHVISIKRYRLLSLNNFPICFPRFLLETFNRRLTVWQYHCITFPFVSLFSFTDCSHRDWLRFFRSSVRTNCEREHTMDILWMMCWFEWQHRHKKANAGPFRFSSSSRASGRSYGHFTPNKITFKYNGNMMSATMPCRSFVLLLLLPLLHSATWNEFRERKKHTQKREIQK